MTNAAPMPTAVRNAKGASAPPTGPDLSDVVDTERYPLSHPGSAAWRDAVGRAATQLGDTGCAVLDGFVRTDALDRLREEGERIAPSAHHEVETVNVYNTCLEDLDPALPPDHPARVRMERGNAFVARDQIAGDLVVHRLYRDRGFHAFLAACFGLPVLHESADPLAGLCLNVVAPGRAHPWHFDTNELAVSMLTRAPDAGGAFEFCPDIRSADRENLAGVAAVLDGRAGDVVRRIEPRPGDLQLFRGRYSLHRVTEVSGTGERHTAIFSYTLRPGVVGSAERTRQLFGRTTAEHETDRVRSDALLD